MRKKGTPAPQPKPLPEIRTVSGREALYWKETQELSNTLAKLRQQRDNYQFILNQLTTKRNAIQKGDIKPEVWKLLTPTSFYLVEDKKEILQELDTEITKYTTAVKGVQAQVRQYEDAYKESGLRLEEFAKRKFGKYRVKTISNDRRITNDEEVLFEADFDKLMKDPELQKQALAAEKTAIEMKKKRLEGTIEPASKVEEVKPKQKTVKK